MNINIQSATTQQAESAQLDRLAHDYLGVPTSLDDESMGCRAGATLNLPTTITATDGVYSDTKAAFEELEVTVNGTEYVRILWNDDICKQYFLDTYTHDSNGLFTTNQVLLPTSLANLSSTGIVSLRCLQYFPNIKNVNGQAYINFSSLTEFAGKYITYTGNNDSFGQVSRLVLPSIIGLGVNFMRGNSSSYRLVDIGGNLTSWSGVYPGTDELILRMPSVISTKSTSTHIFVPSSLVSEYKADSAWSSQASKIFAIGGPTWAETFGSTEPYADLTKEEKSWYDDLFPDLYKDWVAPESDE